MRGQYARVTTPAPPAIWAEVFAADPGALPFHAPSWVGCLAHASRWRDATRLYELSDGRRAVLLMASWTDPSGRLVLQRSWPAGWGAGGLIAAGGVRPSDVALIASDLARSNAISVSVRPAFAAADAWAAAGICAPAVHHIVHVLPLAGSFEQYSSQLPARLRSELRQAERRALKHGLAVREGNSPELVRLFYRAYLTWLERRAAGRRMSWLIRWRGRREESFRRFRTVAETLGHNCQIWVAMLDGRPVGGSVSLYGRQIAVGWRAFTDHDLHRGFRLSESLAYGAIEDAFRRGCTHLEMGESGGRASLASAKTRWGATAHEFDEYFFGAVPWHRVHTGIDAAQRALARRR